MKYSLLILFLLVCGWVIGWKLGDYYIHNQDLSFSIEEKIDNLEKAYQDHLCTMHKRKDLSVWDALHCERK